MSTPQSVTSVAYRPSSPLVGIENRAIYRGENMLLRGLAPQLFYEAYAGSLNLNETIPTANITGTLAFSPASNIVTGSGTNFLGELHIGQQLLANTEVLNVAELISNTSFRTGRLPFSTETAATAEYQPILGELNTNRFAIRRGNAIIFDKGTILCVGDDTLYVNGQPLAGESLVATRRLQVALYDSSTMTYDVQVVGFDDIPVITHGNVTVVASGGIKNMSLGYYSFRVAYYSDSQDGFGNPTDTLLAGGTTGYQIAVANSTFNFDFSADAPPAKATGYILYGSAFTNSSDQSKVNSIQGGWFEFQRVPFTELTAGQIAVEYVDNDLTTLVSFDNDNPSDAEFVTSLDLYPFLVSTNGQGVNSAGREIETSPGPFVSPVKPGNFDAYSNTEKVPTSKGETIIGVVGAAGRVFVLTANTLQAVTPTGLPSAPFTCRPFWKRGFSNPFNLIFIDDTLYGFTSAGVFRSIATGDTGNESHLFAADVESQMASWHASYVYVAHDPQNELVCYCYSAVRQNDEGYWETDIFVYSLRQSDWVTKTKLTDPTRDMIISGVATVANHFEFIAGGRRAGTTNQYDTWRFDNSTGGLEVPWYLTWTYDSNGIDLTPKVIRMLRPKGKFTSAKMQVYIVTPDTDIDVADLETGANPAFEVDLDDSTAVKQYKIFKAKIKNALMHTMRIEGTSVWDGNPNTLKDQFHEISYLLDISGGRK